MQHTIYKFIQYLEQLYAYNRKHELQHVVNDEYVPDGFYGSEHTLYHVLSQKTSHERIKKRQKTITLPKLQCII